jgi:hypothetical protein
MGKAVSKVFGGVAKAATNVVKGVVQPVYNATLKQIPGVDKALVGLDKAVGKSIPGGWGTVAAVASSFIPGAQLAAMGMTKAGLATGLGALSGSGVMKKGHEFNLQGAIVGGAMAYGASQLSQGLQDAASNTTSAAIEGAAKEGTSSGIGSLSPEQLKTLTSADTRILNQLSAGIEGGAGSAMQVAPEVIEGVIPNLAGGTTAAIPGSMAAQNAYELQGLQEGYQSAFREPSMLNKIGTSIAETPKNIGNFLDKATTASTYEGLGSNTMEALRGTGSNIADAGAGIKNLAGFGAESGTAAAARSALTNQFGMGSASALIGGASGLAALEEQKKYLDEQKALGAIGDAEYAKAKASIDAQIAIANRTVADNPFNANPDRSFEKQDTLYAGSSPTDTLYDRPSSDVSASKTLYAMGGSVDDESGMDEARGLGLGNLSNGFMNMGSTPTFAAGGTPRFLSGGGDGMSDSIKASINGTQEARLADGEFVIPADVVSHIGNGSSKAGAKQLYSMMDRVRQARVGTKKQGKQINPRKYMAA